MEKLHYVSIRSYHNEPALELGRRLAEIAPGDLETSFFVSTGSEAVETAVQLVKSYHRQRGNTGKEKFLYRKTGFHGVSLVGASANSSPDYRDWSHPLAPGFFEVPACYVYRRPADRTPEQWGEECAQALEDEIIRQGPDTIAGFMGESIPAALVLPPPPGYLQRIRAICDQYDILWIDDEVFIGLGRTGAYFGSEHYDVVPDVVTVSKGLTGGYIPLGAAIARRPVVDTLIGDGGSGQAKVQGHTYTGHTAACAGALAVLDALENEKLLDNVKRLGDRMQDSFGELAAEHPNVGDVRGKGFLVGIELVKDKETKEPFALGAGIGRKVVQAAAEKGLLCRSARDVVPTTADFLAGDTILLFPAFVANDDEVDRMIDITRESIKEVCAQV
jgi:adenosylmethionine-8-amino-7-oxononanoate aminotransferase